MMGGKSHTRTEQQKPAAEPAKAPAAPEPQQQHPKAGHVRCVALQSVIWNCESMPKGSVLDLPQERFARLERFGHVKRA